MFATVEAAVVLVDDILLTVFLVEPCIPKKPKYPSDFPTLIPPVDVIFKAGALIDSPLTSILRVPLILCVCPIASSVSPDIFTLFHMLIVPLVTLCVFMLSTYKFLAFKLPVVVIPLAVSIVESELRLALIPAPSIPNV